MRVVERDVIMLGASVTSVSPDVNVCVVAVRLTVRGRVPDSLISKHWPGLQVIEVSQQDALSVIQVDAEEPGGAQGGCPFAGRKDRLVCGIVLLLIGRLTDALLSVHLTKSEI